MYSLPLIKKKCSQQQPSHCKARKMIWQMCPVNNIGQIPPKSGTQPFNCWKPCFRIAKRLAGQPSHQPIISIYFKPSSLLSDIRQKRKLNILLIIVYLRVAISSMELLIVVVCFFKVLLCL